MDYFFLSIIASIFVILGYLPELYDIIKTKYATMENITIWFIWSAGSLFSITYCALNQEYYIMSTHVVIFTMNFTTFLLKFYYVKIYPKYTNTNILQDITSKHDNIHSNHDNLV
uniref:PQ-loop repeat-containing protein n=1 Tax=viral metagenome TaxID=1070528 RepID=A0A6C0E2K5_9ZZZZ